MEKIIKETDKPWKYILSKYFKDFMELCWPNRAKEINWSKPPKFLDQELIKIAKDATTGNRAVDKLIEVTLIDGNRCCILIHLEVQATKQANFSKRMFIYRYRLYDWSGGKPIASMAILLDNDVNWRPDNYSQSMWDSEISVKFSIIKIIDYHHKISELEQSTNPFAIIILAQLIALKTQTVELKLASKLQITRKLYNSGFTQQAVIELFRFIDWVINLPKELEEHYMKSVVELEQEDFEKNFMCPAEEIWLEQGIKQGVEQGIKQGITQIANNMLSTGMAIQDIAKFTNLPINVIKNLIT